MIYTPRMLRKSVRLLFSAIVLLTAQIAVSQDLQWQDKSLRDFIAWLVEEDYPIIYSSDLVQADYTVQREPSLSDPLDSLRKNLAPYGLLLTSGPGDTLLIVRDSRVVAQIALTIREAETDYPVEGAKVSIDGVPAGITDRNGKLLIDNQAPGAHLLAVAAADYMVVAPTRILLDAGESTDLNFGLRPIEQPLTEIIVTSSLYNLRYDTSASRTYFDREFTQDLPDIGDDALRSLQRLPGVANGGASTRNHVRGGAINEQLFLFDGLRLYEPYHLKDFQSLSTIVDQNAVAGIDFYSAGYQVQYGDRMSGVVDVSMRQAETDAATELALSFFNASILSLGRFGGSGKGDWLVTGRRGNLDLVADAVNSDYGTPRYQDAVLHVGWELDDRTYISGNLLLSYDKISLTVPDGTESAYATYRNRVGWLKMENQWTANLSTSTILSATLIDNSRIGEVMNPAVVSGDVNDNRNFHSVSLRQDWQWASTEKLLWSAGFDIKDLEADYDYNSTLGIFPPFDQLFDNQPLLQRDILATPEGMQYAFYVAARWRPLDKLILDAGLRWDQQTYTTANNDDQLSPRFNLLYYFNDNTEFRFGFGRYYQAQEINELQVADGIETFSAAQRASHVVASISHELRSGIDVRLELYEKKYRSLMPHSENAFNPLALLPELQIDRLRITAGAAVSRGAEILLSRKNDAGDLFWWISYDWSLVEDQFSDGNTVRSWDETNALKAGVNWDWNDWSFSAAGSAHTGWPRTDLIVESVVNPDGTTTLLASTTPRNALRFGTFHTVDARASRRFKVSKGELVAFVEFTNIYDRQNACCTEYSVQTDSGGNQSLLVDTDHWLPLIPSLGVIWRF